MRLMSMCRGSQSIATFEWFGSQPTPVTQDRQECINWEALDEWAAERKVDLYDLDQLADRPEEQPWEVVDHDVRLGVKEGDTKGYEGMLEGTGGVRSND